MTLSYSASNLFLIIVFSSFCSTVMAEKELHRQSRQNFLLPKSYEFARNFPLPHYYPYRQLITIPAGRSRTQGSDFPYLSSPWLSDDIDIDTDNYRYASRSSAGANILIRPHAKECLKENTAVDGGRTCNVASRANSGSIDIKFSENNQIAFVDITASKNFSVTLVCTDITDAAVFTRGGQISATTDTPRTQAGYMSIVATSTTTTGTLKCSWFSHPN